MVVAELWSHVPFKTIFIDIIRFDIILSAQKYVHVTTNTGDRKFKALLELGKT